MECKAPFEAIEHVGCLWLFKKDEHSFDEGQEACHEVGGDVFEFNVEFSRTLNRYLYLYLLRGMSKLKRILKYLLSNSFLYKIQLILAIGIRIVFGLV